jgi:hypothetical protein
MSGLIEDREPFPDEEDPANQADELGAGIDPHQYFEDLNRHLEAVADAIIDGEDDEDDAEDDPDVTPQNQEA